MEKDNKQKILDVALELFYDKGYDAVGVQEIVEKSEVTKPTLYYYFGSKYGLLEELLKEGFSSLQQEIDQAIAESTAVSAAGDYDVPLILFKVAKAFLHFANTDSKFFAFMLSLMYSARGNEPYQAVRPHLHNLYRSMIGLFEQLGDKLGNMNGRQEAFAMGFLGFLNQFAYTFSEKQYAKEENQVYTVSDEDVEAIVKQFMYGIVN